MSCLRRHTPNQAEMPPGPGAIMMNRPLYHDLMKTEEYFALYHEYFDYLIHEYFEKDILRKKSLK